MFLGVRWPLGPHRVYFGMLAHLRLATQAGVGVKWVCFEVDLTRAAEQYFAVSLFFTLEMPDPFRFNLDFAL